jgi:hypothetical protein
MIPVSHPLLKPEVEPGQIQKYSQKMVLPTASSKMKKQEGMGFFASHSRIRARSKITSQN